MLEKEAKERAKDYTDDKKRQVAYVCGFLDGVDFGKVKAIEWYKIREKLPENGTCVLCALNDGGLETAYYEDSEFTFCAPAYHAQDVVAWCKVMEYNE